LLLLLIIQTIFSELPINCCLPAAATIISFPEQPISNELELLHLGFLILIAYARVRHLQCRRLRRPDNQLVHQFSHLLMRVGYFLVVVHSV